MCYAWWHGKHGAQLAGADADVGSNSILLATLVWVPYPGSQIDHGAISYGLSFAVWKLSAKQYPSGFMQIMMITLTCSAP